jgi:hypothetical protein
MMSNTSGDMMIQTLVFLITVAKSLLITRFHDIFDRIPTLVIGSIATPPNLHSLHRHPPDNTTPTTNHLSQRQELLEITLANANLLELILQERLLST